MRVILLRTQLDILGVLLLNQINFQMRRSGLQLEKERRESSSKSVFCKQAMRAFGYLRRIIAISNQFSDERGGVDMLCEDTT